MKVVRLMKAHLKRNLLFYSRLIMMAVDPPPPLQMAAHPNCPGLSALIRLTRIRQPEAPIG